MSRQLKQEAVGAHIRQLRSDRGMSVRELAKQTDFSPSFISQVENGLASPSISSMQKIAEALGVTLGEFFAAAAGGEGGYVVRAADRQALTSGWSDAEIEALVSRPSARLEPILITLHPGGRSAKHPFPHPHEEFGFVLEGEVSLTLGPETHILKRGDAVTILPRESRRWENEGPRTARILLIAARQPIVNSRTTR
jgi:transcriptional regulator with XRE-family HTH domain